MDTLKSELHKEVKKLISLWIENKVDTENFMQLLSLPYQVKQEVSQVLHMADANYTIARSYSRDDETTLEEMEAVLEEATQAILTLSLK